MKYGFIIDNRKCIGCHACTTACKSEHQVPIGVNRTWVKQVEKGVFPHSRRLFSVMRCNHCTDAPCVEICPVEALYFRPDGIVDFDNRRCIGCKSCMQACPYDALYIDPQSHTAAKCNYCAHRIDIGLEPACVNVCPEHAIISGDMHNPDSEIAQLLARQAVKVRKPEKYTEPNVFYIDADDASLNPSITEKQDNYFWNSQTLGVGHYAKEAEKMAYTNDDVIEEIIKNDSKNGIPKSIDVLMGNPKRIYDAPDKGILWGWEVSAYIWTKAISAGVILVAVLGFLLNQLEFQGITAYWSIGLGIFFLLATGLFLVKDLDRPDRFLNVLLRPQWNSWLVRGGYAISLYGGMLTLMAICIYFDWGVAISTLGILTALIAVIVATYTAFLLAQAKGRDFWQSPTLSIHMLVHSFMAGISMFLILESFVSTGNMWIPWLKTMMWIVIGINLFTIASELYTSHPTKDSKTVVNSILRGKYRNRFWLVVILLGNLIPMLILRFDFQGSLAVTGVLVLLGVYFINHIWVEAPQKISLS